MAKTWANVLREMSRETGLLTGVLRLEALSTPAAEGPIEDIQKVADCDVALGSRKVVTFIPRSALLRASKRGLSIVPALDRAN